tara:strand:+ start:210 stop:665 length:456 start_codon:yes stop_codon:yes gene_type:complete
MSYDDNYDYLIYKIPANLDLKYINDLREKVSNIGYLESEFIFKITKSVVPDDFDPSLYLEQEDIYNLSKDDLDKVSKRIMAKKFFNESIEEILMPRLACTLSHSNLFRNDLSYVDIDGATYIITGGERRYSYNSPTKAYDYLVALNFLDSI